MKIPIFGKPVEYTLKISGLWPDYFNIFGVIFVMSGLFTMIPFQILDVIKQFDNALILMDDLSLLIAEIMLYSKFLIICYHRRVFKSLLLDMARDYENENKINDWSELISASRRFSKFVYGMYASTATSFYVQFFFTYPLIPVEQREMLMRAQYPFDYRSSPTFEIMNAVQIAQGLIMTCVQALSESLLVSLVLYVCGHIQFLSEKIDEFSTNCRNNRKNPFLKPLIMQHLKILRAVDKLEKVYSYASFVQVFLSTFMICSCCYYATMTDDILVIIKCSMLCFTALWQGYSFCFSGQRLINKSEKIASQLYATFWYDAHPKEISAVSYMISKSQLPLTLTAGKFTSLSAETFSAMMKTSFSYISVLKATRE